MKRILPRVAYLWEKHILRRIELFTQEDTAKKPEIPQTSKMAQVHQRFLDRKAKRTK